MKVGITQLVGHPPMHYPAKWRMKIASELLTSSNANIATIAESGYGSEESFSRAFRR
jgi:transcriptional regulator GlxA family with amidase domain